MKCKCVPSVVVVSQKTVHSIIPTVSENTIQREQVSKKCYISFSIVILLVQELPSLVEVTLENVL